MDNKKEALCKMCGQKMPDGEEMFNYHGYSCDCPKIEAATETNGGIGKETTIDETTIELVKDGVIDENND